MALKITSLKSAKKTSVQSAFSSIPYIEISITWKVENDELLLSLFKRHSQDYEQAFSPEKPEEDLFSSNWKKVWVIRDPIWLYLEKYNTFWLKDCIADCNVTRAALANIQAYQQEGKLPEIHRCTEEYAVFLHLETLTRYWD